MTGPTQPTTMDQKIAGFSREAQRMYMPGFWKNWTGAMVDCVLPATNSMRNWTASLPWVDVEAFDYGMSHSEGEGVVLSVLHQLDIPIMKNTGINAQPGKAIQGPIPKHYFATNDGTIVPT